MHVGTVCVFLKKYLSEITLAGAPIAKQTKQTIASAVSASAIVLDRLFVI